MAIKSDAQGFLVGELIKTQDQILTAQQDSVRVLSRIRADVSAIARAINVQTKMQARTTVSGQGGQRAPRVVPSAPGRSSNGSRTVGGNQTASPTARAQAQAVARRSSSATVAVTPSRDAQGRFVAGQSRGGAGGGGAAGGGSLAAIGGGLSRLSDGMGRLSASLGSADNLDPTVNAMKEVTDVVSPLGRGLFAMFGRSAERKKERWYQRFYKALTSPIGKRQEVTATVGKPGLLSTMMGGMFGGVGGLLSKVPALLMGLLTRIFLPIAAVWGSWELGKWIGTKIYAWLDESGWNTKLFDAVDWLKEAFGNAWKSVGEGIDSVTGMIEGAWKTITDGFKSALDGFMEFPKKIGEFFSGLDESMRNLPVIGKAYAAAADAVKATTTEAKKGYEEGKTGDTKEPSKGVVQAVARDVGKTVAATQAVGAQAKAGYDEARTGKTDAAAPSGLVQRAARAVGGATGWVLGKTSERYESGGKGAGTVSTGAGDFGGASYGTYQLASKTGTLSKFLNSTEYGKQFEGLTPGTAAFNAKWKDVAANDKNFGAAQHKFIEDTHFNPQMQALQKAGIDLSGRGAAVKDAVWSTSVQFGGKSGLIQKALAGKDHAKMSDAEIVSAIQDYKATNNDKLFASSSAAVRAGTLNRATSEKSALLKLDATQTAGLPTPAGAGVPASVPAQLPEQAKNEVPEKLNAGAAAGGKVQVSLKDKTTQNIGDRGIAHIVTGGMGG